MEGGEWRVEGGGAGGGICACTLRHVSFQTNDTEMLKALPDQERNESFALNFFVLDLLLSQCCTKIFFPSINKLNLSRP